MKTTKTSVVICTYNGAKYIAQQLDSILQQTIPIDEIIICDDCSTDETLSILEKYQHNYPIIKIFHNPTNIGSTAGFQKGIQHCKNEIVFFADQDDEWLPFKVETFLEAFKQNPEIKVISSNGNGILNDQIITNSTSVWDIPALLAKMQNSEVIDYFSLIANVTNIATGSAMAARKSFLMTIPEFPSVSEIHHDEFIALIAAKEKKYLFLDKKLYNYRIHESQQVGQNFFSLNLKNLKHLIKMYLKNKDFSDYKRILKILSVRFKFYNDILKNNALDAYYKDLILELRNTAKNAFLQNQEEMQRRYPLKSALQNGLDFITQKRKI